jgi:hypothetical protein
VALGALALGLLLAAAPPVEPTTVSELVVTATKAVSELTVTAPIKCLAPSKYEERAERPKVVSTFPAKGAVVAPGLLVLRVTFDRPMACDGRLGRDPPWQDPCPGAVQEMLLSYDRRTVRTVCVVDPNLHYGAVVNGDVAGKVFIGLTGLPAESRKFDFATSSGPVITTVCEALAQDAETAGEIAKRHKLDCAAAARP